MALVWAGARFSTLFGQSACGVTLNPTQAYVPYAGGNLSFNATTTGGYNSCGLTITSGASWIAVLGFTSNSPSTVNLQVSSGSSSSRSGAVTVASGSANASFSVYQSGSIQISPNSLSPGAVGAAYGPVTFSASNGVGVYSWSASGLPPGLSFSSSGVLSGTPASGSSAGYNPVFTVTDSSNTTASVNLPLTITSSVSPPTITSPSSLSSGTVGVSYGPVTFAASGGTGGYTWSASGLPSGLSVSTGGVLSGTPATGSQGAYSLQVTVRDSSSTAANTILALTINPSTTPFALFVPCPPLGTLTEGTPVSGGCAAFGGTSPYTFSIYAGALPAGLSLNSATGTIGGTPTAAGPYSFTVEAADSSSPTQTARGTPENGTVNLPGSITDVVAHAADGNNFKTTFILIDTDSSAAPYTLRFDDESGNIPSSPVPLAVGSLEGTISAGGDITVSTAGTEPYVGWAELSAPSSVGGSVIYSQQNANSPTRQEGTTTLNSTGSTHFFVPFDNTQGAVTAMALTNPGPSANVTVTLRYSDGAMETPSFPSLAERSHQSFALPTQFPNASGQSGVAEFVSTVPLYAVVFRFNPTDAFTALDVVQPGPASPSITRTLSHAADGIGFKTTILLTNTGTLPASYALQFDDEQGNVPSPPVGLELGALTGTIAAGESATIRTAGTGPFVGWAELTAPASVGGSVIYSQHYLTTIQEGTATIVSTGTEHFFVPFDNTNGAITAMALTNSGASAADLTVTVRYSDGTVETPSFPALASRNHESFNIPQQFPNAANRSGVLEFVSSSPLYAVAFRFNPTGAFTALGVVSQ
jgi:trimeric autotransporter adhesin